MFDLKGLLIHRVLIESSIMSQVTTRRSITIHAPESGAGRAEAVPMQRLELRPDVGRVDDEVLLRRDRAPPEVTQAYDVRNDKAGEGE